MSQELSIEPAGAEDLPAIAELAELIWREHYTPIIGSQQVEYMLDKFQSVAAMQQQIEDGVEYYQLLLDDQLVGYFSFYEKDDALFLSKIYVASELRGQGIGRRAIDFIADSAVMMGFNKIRLTVNKYNSNSINAYLKMGFIITDDVVMDIGGGFVMDDYVMELSLTEKE